MRLANAIQRRQDRGLTRKWLPLGFHILYTSCYPFFDNDSFNHRIKALRLCLYDQPYWWVALKLKRKMLLGCSRCHWSAEFPIDVLAVSFDRVCRLFCPFQDSILYPLLQRGNTLLTTGFPIIFFKMRVLNE